MRLVADNTILKVIQDACPGWRVWTDCTGWHAMRRGDFIQQKGPGSALYSVHGADQWELIAALAQQEFLAEPVESKGA